MLIVQCTISTHSVYYSSYSILQCTCTYNCCIISSPFKTTHCNGLDKCIKCIKIQYVFFVESNLKAFKNQREKKFKKGDLKLTINIMARKKLFFSHFLWENCKLQFKI